MVKGLAGDVGQNCSCVRWHAHLPDVEAMLVFRCRLKAQVYLMDTEGANRLR